MVGRGDGAHRPGGAVRLRTGGGLRRRTRPAARRRSSSRTPAAGSPSTTRSSWALLARRFAPARCVVLDDGVRVDLDAAGRLPSGVRVLVDRRSDRRPTTPAARRDRVDPAAGDQPAQGAAAAGRRRGGPLPGPAPGADRGGLPVHLPLPRRGGRGAPGPAGARAARPAPAAPAARHRPVVGGAGAARRARGSSTSWRSAAASTSSGSTTRSTRTARTPPSAAPRSASPPATPSPEWIAARPGGAPGRAGRGRRCRAGPCAGTPG